MNAPLELTELVAALERRTKEHLAFKRRGPNPHCASHDRFQPDCVPCLEEAERYLS